jgi:mono/diheme cytochrome c family protein
MNYPLWSLPAKGLLIAAVAIVHVFISHFAVGGGLFLVLAERKARRERDEALLGYVRAHTRFFVLLTLVMGAMTGVGIWFTIGLVHPDATSSLINTFVWGWAIEWTFFVTEIAAAMVYYYGWDRLDARTHEIVGWIYFASAWLSLAVINGILTFMLTPGAWLANHGFVAGILNPTYLPSLAARTCAAIGLAGLYALLTAARLADAGLKERVARYAARWILPMALGLPLSVAAYLAVAFLVGVPLGEPLGGPGGGLGGVAGALLRGSASGSPVAIRAAQAVLVASVCTLLLSLVATRLRPRTYGRPLAVATLACAFVALGGGEWVREDIRKPFVIGGYMYVNGVYAAGETRGRAFAAAGEQAEGQGAASTGRFSAAALDDSGVLGAVSWVNRLPPPGAADRAEAEGAEVFRLLCSSCHTVDGYLGIRRLVAGKSQPALRTMLEHLDTWRGRRMPPFTGIDAEGRALAFYLSRLGGSRETLAEAAPAAGSAAAYFDANCSACHGPGAEFQIGGRGRTAAQVEEMLGRLPSINDAMPPFDGPAELRRPLAEYLAALPAPAKQGGGR